MSRFDLDWLCQQVNANVTTELLAMGLRLENYKEGEESLLLKVAKDDYTIEKLESAGQVQDRRHAEEVRNRETACDLCWVSIFEWRILISLGSRVQFGARSSGVVWCGVV
jgi:hypothetical protein